MKASEALGILNLSGGASPEQIKKAYFRLVRTHSPEKDPEQFQRIREAYELLRDHGDEQEVDSALRYPSDPGVYMLIQSAEAYRKAGKHGKAAALLEQAVRLAPDEPVPLFEIVQCYLSAGNFQKAAAKAERLIQICPENRNAWNLYAVALYNRGWYKKALPAFRRFHDLDQEGNLNNLVPYMQCAFWAGQTDEGTQVSLRILEKETWKEADLEYPLEALNCMVTYQKLTKEPLKDFLNLYLCFLRANQNILHDIQDILSPLFGLLRRKIEHREATKESCDSILPVVNEVIRLFPAAESEANHFKYVLLNHTLGQDRKLELDVWPFMASILANDRDESDAMLRYKRADAQMYLLTNPENTKTELLYIQKAYPLLYASYANFFDALLSGKTEKIASQVKWEYEKLRSRFSGGFYETVTQKDISEPPMDFEKPDSLKELFAASEPVVRDKPKVGRNDPCPCGSGRKFKQCCIGKGLYD